jgi:hypothetical protein
MDEQQIELIGTAALSAALIREGFEIAHPVRDHGIDLIVFSDTPGRPFSAIPVQVKAHSGEALGISRKYEKFGGLVYAVIWMALTQPRFLLLDHSEAVSLLPESSRQSDSWTRTDGKAGWTWTTAPKHVHAGLSPFENRWAWLRHRLDASVISVA